jgi:hypothetical protein
MPKDHVPATPGDLPTHLQEERDLAEELEKQRKEKADTENPPEDQTQRE